MGNTSQEQICRCLAPMIRTMSTVKVDLYHCSSCKRLLLKRKRDGQQRWYELKEEVYPK